MTAWLIGVAVAAIVIAVLGMYHATLADIYKEKLATSEVFMVTTRDLWKIRVCRYRKGRTNGQPILLVHGANVNQHNFTSPRGSSMVDFFVDRGFDCWTVDLRGSRTSIPPFERHRGQITIDDYLNDDIPTMIQLIKQETGYARVHYCGHSMGGMLLYAYVAKYGAGDIASAVTLGAPLGFDDVPVRRSRFLIALLCLYPPFIGGVARDLIPLCRLLHLRMGAFPMNMQNLAKGLDSSYFYNMLEDPLPGVLKQLCHWTNTPGWRMDGGQLDMIEALERLDVPLFALYAPRDPFVSVKRARAFFEALPTGDKRMVVCSKENGYQHDYNHCDLAFSREGAREVFAPIARWIDTHAVRERMPVKSETVAADYQTPLAPSERAEILSGESFAHLTEAEEAVRDEARAEPSEATPELEQPAPATPKRAAKKKPATKKKAAAKNEEAAPGRKADTASHTRGKGPDLASASAALSALRPQAGSTPPGKADPIRIDSASRRTAPDAGEPVATPESVLKALSSASGKLDAFKDKRDDSDS